MDRMDTDLRLARERAFHDQAFSEQTRATVRRFYSVNGALRRWYERELADAFATSWGSWIGGGGAVYTRNPHGAGILVSVRSANPLGLTSVLRTTWH